MRRVERKNQRLQDRMLALQQEIRVLDGSIHALSKAVANPEREDALRKLRQVGSDARPGAGSAVPEERDASGRGRAADHEDMPDQVWSGITVGNQFPEQTSEYEKPLSKTGPDQKFASYFVTGGLHSVRPLRQERRLQRNKAIFMLIVAILLLYGVIQLLF